MIEYSAPTDSWTPLRRQMVADQIAARGVRDGRVLGAMEELPRHLFVPEAQRIYAYEDRALPIGYDQTISQPFIVAYMTEQLRLGPGLKVLEVGTGSGYQAALLAMLGAVVETVELIEPLSQQAAGTIESLGIRGVTCIHGDGSTGPQGDARYDRIIVAAGAPAVPQPLVERLVDGGRLVMPVGGGDEQVLVAIDQRPGRWIETPLIPCRFVKLLGERGWPLGY